jgi:hypothetical protein
MRVKPIALQAVTGTLLVYPFAVGLPSADVSVALRDGGAARIMPRIEDGRIEVQMLDAVGQPSGEPKVVPLRNQVAPEISVAVRTIDDGFRFEYRVRNHGAARQRVNDWKLVLSDREAIRHVEQPRLWSSGVTVSGVSLVQHGLDGALSAVIFSWYRMVEPAPYIGPGEALSGFALHSSYAPGIVYSYTFGEWPDDSILGELPQEVTKAMLPFLGLEHQSQPRITVGPYFPPGTTMAAVIESYQRRLLSAHKRFLGRIEESYLDQLLDLLAKSRDSGPAALCEFTATARRAGAEESIRQGIQAAICVPR